MSGELRALCPVAFDPAVCDAIVDDGDEHVYMAMWVGAAVLVVFGIDAIFSGVGKRRSWVSYWCF